jgi:hypothetical protein
VRDAEHHPSVARRHRSAAVLLKGIDNGKARPEADAVLLMTPGIDRSEWNEEW